MLAKDLVISLLKGAQKPIEGRTAFQKLAYFSCQRLGADFHFRPHYYGPFSDVVAQTLFDLVSMGYVEEKEIVTGLDRTMFTYQLTSDGTALARRIQQQNSDEFKQIKAVVNDCENIVGNDYEALSWAAKVFFLLNRENKEISYKHVREEGERLGWKLDNVQVDKGVSLLEGLHLAQASRSG